MSYIITLSTEISIEENHIEKSTTTRRAGGLNFRPKAEKAKALQCFKRCTCNRVRCTRFVWQEIKSLRGDEEIPWRLCLGADSDPYLRIDGLSNFSPGYLT